MPQEVPLALRALIKFDMTFKIGGMYATLVVFRHPASTALVEIFSGSGYRIKKRRHAEDYYFLTDCL